MYEPCMFSVLPIHFQNPGLYSIVLLSSSPTFPCLFFTQQNSLLNYGCSKMKQRLKGYRNASPWTRTQLSAWIEFGVKGEVGRMLWFYWVLFILFFFQKISTGRGKLCFQATTTLTKIPPTTRQNKINRSLPSTVLIHENVYSPYLYKINLFCWMKS